jgi:heme oxygenase
LQTEGDRGFYGQLLRHYHRLHHQLDSAIGPANHHHGLGLPIAAKATWLAEDLQALQLSPLPAAPPLPALSLPQLLGTVYVVEGSMLGGQWISKRLQASLGIDASNGARFFSGYGNDSAEHWASVGQQCQAHYQPDMAQCCIDAALQVFSQFNSMLTALQEQQP